MTNTIKKLAIAGGVLCIAYIGINNLVFDNENMIHDPGSDYHRVSRADGLFSHTELKRFESGDYISDEVYKFRFIGSSMFIDDGGLDGKHDGVVDKIYIPGDIFSKLSGSFTREKDYEKYKELFDDADKTLAETKERFKKYFPDNNSIFNK